EGGIGQRDHRDGRAGSGSSVPDGRHDAAVGVVGDNDLVTGRQRQRAGHRVHAGGGVVDQGQIGSRYVDECRNLCGCLAHQRRAVIRSRRQRPQFTQHEPCRLAFDSASQAVLGVEHGVRDDADSAVIEVDRTWIEGPERQQVATVAHGCHSICCSPVGIDTESVVFSRTRTHVIAAYRPRAFWHRAAARGPPSCPGRTVKLHTKLFVALALGGIIGILLHPYADQPAVAWAASNVLRPIRQVVLRAIFMIVVRMVFSALVIGVYELGQGRGLPGVAGRTLLFTTILSSASVIVGLLLVNGIRPGDRLRLSAALPQAASVDDIEANAAAARPLADTLIELVPRNPLESAVRALDGEMLPLMVFALAFGAAISFASRRRATGAVGEAPTVEREGTAAVDGDAIEAGGGRGVLIAALDDVFEACMAIIRFVMRFAPLAVFALVCTTAITFGTTVFGALGLFVLTVVT